MVRPLARPQRGSGDDLSGVARQCRRRAARWPIAWAVALAAAPCALTAFWKPPMRFVWNVSASAPRGIYAVLGGRDIRRGDGVIAWLPARYTSLAARRAYLPAGVPLVKRVAASAGDRVCAVEQGLRINGRVAALIKTIDARGRHLPHWGGCVELTTGQFLLLGEHPWSFDGRYFGVTRSSEIIGRAVLLWRA